MIRSKTSALSKQQTFDYVLERLRIAGAATKAEPIFSQKALEAIHMFSLGIPRVVNLLCEHALINGYAQQKRPIEPETIEEVAREFQLDEVEPIAPAGSLHPGSDVYTSEAFIQNLGHALLRFRLGPPVSPDKGRK